MPSQGDKHYAFAKCAQKEVPDQLTLTILLYGCETWLVRVADERMLVAFDDINIGHILCERRSDCAPTVEFRRSSVLNSVPVQ